MASQESCQAVAAQVLAARWRRQHGEDCPAPVLYRDGYQAARSDLTSYLLGMLGKPRTTLVDVRAYLESVQRDRLRHSDVPDNGLTVELTDDEMDEALERAVQWLNRPYPGAPPATTIVDTENVPMIAHERWPVGSEVGIYRWAHCERHPSRWAEPMRGIVLALDDRHAWKEVMPKRVGTLPRYIGRDDHGIPRQAELTRWVEQQIVDGDTFDDRVPVRWHQGHPGECIIWERVEGTLGVRIQPYAEDLEAWRLARDLAYRSLGETPPVRQPLTEES